MIRLARKRSVLSLLVPLLDCLRCISLWMSHFTYNTVGWAPFYREVCDPGEKGCYLLTDWTPLYQCCENMFLQPCFHCWSLLDLQSMDPFPTQTLWCLRAPSPVPLLFCKLLDLTPSPCPLRSSRALSPDVFTITLPASSYLWPRKNDSDSCPDACKVSGLGPSPLRTYLNLFSPQKKPTRQVLLSPILQTAKLRFSEVKGLYVLL